MTPDWLGSPQHLVAGALVGAATVAFARDRIRPVWAVLVLAVGVVAVAELLVELIEYPLLYGDNAGARAYYDTIADLAITLVGGIAGTLTTFAFLHRTR